MDDSSDDESEYESDDGHTQSLTAKNISKLQKQLHSENIVDVATNLISAGETNSG